MTILIQNTAAGFTSDNPVLTIHQVGQETDTKLTKQGDGSTAWNDLDYDTPTKEAFEQILSGLRNKVPSSYAVQQALAGVAPVWGSITGDITDQTDLIDALADILAMAEAYTDVAIEPFVDDSIAFGFEGYGGSVITVGSVATWQADCAGTITGWEVVESSDVPVVSDIVIDLWKDTYTNYPPTVFDTITGGGAQRPNLSAGIKNQNGSLSAWTLPFVKGDFIKAKVISVTSAKKVRCKIIFDRA